MQITGPRLVRQEQLSGPQMEARIGSFKRAATRGRELVNIGGVSFTDANIGTAVGLDLSLGSAAVLRTTDGGNTWVTKYSNAAAWITG